MSDDMEITWPSNNANGESGESVDNEHTCNNSVTFLTTGISALNVSSDNNAECNDMTDDPRLEQAFALIRAVIADADKRATDDLVAKISGQRPVTQPQKFDEASPDRRAPRGSAGALIERALTDAGGRGLTVLGIQAAASTDYEKMVTTSAIRNWLKDGERKRPPKYRQVGGVWFLAGNAPPMKVVS